MSSNTPNLNLLKMDPVADGNQTFNIKTMINDNLDKIDTEVGKRVNQADYDLHKTDNTAHGLGNALKVTPTLSYGMNNKITMGQLASEFLKMGFTGQTLINLLGKDGNCEDTSKFLSTSGITYSLDPTNKVFGNNSIKSVLTSTTGYFVQDAINKIDKTKYYMVSSHLKNGNATNVQLSFYGVLQKLSTITDTTKFNRVCVRVQPSDINTVFQVGTVMNGAIGQYANTDGIQINEISASDYTNLTDAQLLAKYPYVDSYTCLQNPYIEVRHDNLVRNGNSEEGTAWWTANNSISTLSVVNGKFQLVTTGSSGHYQYINVKPNTNYYFTSNVVGSNGYVRVKSYDDLVILAENNGTFNTGSNSTIIIRMATSSATTLIIDSIMLIEGTTPPSTYKPCRIERCAIEGKFTSDDTVTLENGKLSGLLNWKHKTLYGKDYDWKFGTDSTGSKRVYIAKPNQVSGSTNNILCKYDGSLLSSQVGALNANTFDGGSDGVNFHIGIADTDSGWSETINPNDDEAKCPMNGWKAVWSTGARYTGWLSIVDGSVPSGAVSTIASTVGSNATVTVTANTGTNFINGDMVYIVRNGTFIGNGTVSSSTANTITFSSALTWASGDIIVKADNGTTNTTLLNYCKTNVAPNFEGYQLHYKLANPEPITDVNTKVTGTIPKLDNGDNYIYLDSGMVLGEVATVKSDSFGAYTNITYPGLETMFHNKTEVISAIYKNNLYDNNWGEYGQTQYKFGNSAKSISLGNYDANATYTVDYKILSTVSPLLGSISCSYSQDLFSAVRRNTEAIEGKQKQDSALDNIIDLSIYEDVKGINVIGRAGAWNKAEMYSGNITFVSPKKTKPILMLKPILAYACNSGQGLDIVPLSDIALGIVRLDNYGFACEFTYKGTNTTIQSNLINYGFVVKFDYIADCRGRI